MRASVILRAATAVFVVGFLACSDDTGTAAVDYGPLLQSLTTEVILPEHEAFATSADALVTSLRDLEATPTADTLAKSQTAWRTARAAFRHLDALHFGPIAEFGISERIDFAPAKSADIEALIAGSVPIDAALVGSAGGHAKGFLGAEYILFSSKGAAEVLLQLQGTGANDVLATRRRALVRAFGDEIAASAHQLNDAWLPTQGGYAKDIIGAGTSSARYPSQRAALDEVVGGVAYAFEVIVAVRLGLPLGRKSGGTPDPGQDPTGASDNAAADVNASLTGINALYTGQGLTTRVRLRSTILDTRIGSQISECAAKVSAIPVPFQSALTSSTASVQATYDACKSAKGTWNTDVTSALGATLKPSDNDGD